MTPRLMEKLLAAWSLRLRAFWLEGKRVATYGAVGDHKVDVTSWTGREALLHEWLTIIPDMEHSDKVALTPPANGTAVLEAFAPGKRMGNADFPPFFIYLHECPFRQSSNMNMEFQGNLTDAIEVPGVDANHRAILEFETELERTGQWEPYHDWCLENGWAARADELRLYTPNFS